MSSKKLPTRPCTFASDSAYTQKTGDRFLVSGFIIFCNKLSALYSSGNHTLNDLLTEYKIENYDGCHGH